jgi:hypothetical protein
MRLQYGNGTELAMVRASSRSISEIVIPCRILI